MPLVLTPDLCFEEFFRSALRDLDFESHHMMVDAINFLPFDRLIVL